jgi:hypothetical protein
LLNPPFHTLKKFTQKNKKINSQKTITEINKLPLTQQADCGIMIEATKIPAKTREKRAGEVQKDKNDSIAVTSLIAVCNN